MNSHKVLPFFIISFFIIISSCGKDKKQILSLENQLDSVKNINTQQQLVLDDMTSYIAQISAVMDSINAHEGILTLQVDENGKPLARRKILENLAKLEEILMMKRFEINRLDSLINQRNDQVRNLSMMIRHLYAEIDAKDQTIQELRKEVNAKDIKIRKLTGTVNDLTTEMADLTDTLEVVKERTAEEVSSLKEMSRQMKEQNQKVYYVIGRTKVLQEAGILTKEFLKKSSVNSSEFTEDKFTQSDMYELKEIEIVGKFPKIMSLQPPASSYELVSMSNGKDIYKLTILDPDQFWKASKYLVIKVM